MNHIITETIPRRPWECTPTPHERTAITYDPATGDYAMHLDGALIGFACTPHAGEIALAELIDAIDSAALEPFMKRFCRSCGDFSIAVICPACVEYHGLAPVAESVEG